MARPAHRRSSALLRVAVAATALAAAAIACPAAEAGGPAYDGPFAASPPSARARAIRTHCGAQALPPRGLLKPPASYATPPVIYGPYRGPQPWSAGAHVMRKTACLHAHAAGAARKHKPFAWRV